MQILNQIIEKIYSRWHANDIKTIKNFDGIYSLTFTEQNSKSEIQIKTDYDK